MGRNNNQMVCLPVRRSPPHRDSTTDMGLSVLRGLEDTVQGVSDADQEQPSRDHVVQRLHLPGGVLQGHREERQCITLS